MPKPNFETLLAIPACYDPNMTDEDWQAEIDRMFYHSRNTQQFIAGKLSPADYEDSIAQLGFNPYELENLWAEGESLLLL